MQGRLVVLFINVLVEILPVFHDLKVILFFEEFEAFFAVPFAGLGDKDVIFFHVST